jgi:hypothetical protein
MAKRAAGNDVNKSEAIRAYNRGNTDAGPTAIAAALAKDGIKVTPGFVSTVLSTDRRKSGKTRRRRKGGRPPKAAAARSRRDAYDNLVQANEFAKQMGGVEKAQAALDALARILG